MKQVYKFYAVVRYQMNGEGHYEEWNRTFAANTPEEAQEMSLEDIKSQLRQVADKGTAKLYPGTYRIEQIS